MGDLYGFGYTLEETIKTMSDGIATGNHDRMFLDTYYWLQKLSEYRAIGTVEECRAAVEKLPAAEEAIRKLLCGEYGSFCRFCIHDEDEVAMYCNVGGSGSWCCKNAKWNGKLGRGRMRLIDADELIKGRTENDPVRIAAMCAPTVCDNEVVEKQKAKRIEYETNAVFSNGFSHYRMGKCPMCDNRYNSNEEINYCSKCGQKLDWSEEE